MKNITLAIDAAPAAIPVNPNRAAMIAITRNTTVHLNITFNFRLLLILFYFNPYIHVSYNDKITSAYTRDHYRIIVKCYMIICTQKKYKLTIQTMQA